MRYAVDCPSIIQYTRGGFYVPGLPIACQRGATVCLKPGATAPESMPIYAYSILALLKVCRVGPGVLGPGTIPTRVAS